MLLLSLLYRISGKEFAYHEQIAQLLQLKYLFAHPYAAWERGNNENINGLLRQYFPKKCDLPQLSLPYESGYVTIEF